MASEIKVDKVRITVGRKVLEFSLEEVRQLYEILGELCPKETTTYIPAAPIVIRERTWPHPSRCRDTWCDMNTTRANSGSQTLCLAATRG